MSDETISQVIDRARDGRPYQLIHARMMGAGVEVSYQAVRAWLRGDSVPSLHHVAALFDALQMDDDERLAAIEAARREG